MDRRTFIGAIACGLVMEPLNTQADQTGKVYRIGYLGSSSAGASANFFDAFRTGLRELGWVEGQNIVIESRFAQSRFERLPELAAELVRLKVDVIAAGPTPPAMAAKNATGTIPIVIIAVGDPVGVGLVTNLARPGGNVTGLSYAFGMDIFGKQLELLRAVLPKIRRVAVLSNPANPAQALAVDNVESAARSLEIQLQPLGARDASEIDRAFASIAKQRTDALLVVADSVFNLHRVRLAELSASYRLPAIYGLREHVEAGGLMSYGPNLSDQYRRAAYFVHKILKGAKPGDLPVEQPATFALEVNLKTAKALGLTIPQSVLARADEVIQ